MKSSFIVLLLLCSTSLVAFDQSHSEWDQILKQYVSQSEYKSSFDYEALLKDKENFESYLQDLSAVAKKDFDTWSLKQQQAFLINSYNAFTIKLIIDNYPVKSIKDNKISWLSPFNKKFFKLFGKERSLSDVEHKMLREWYKEARVHFAIVCASIGCPAIQNQAFTDKNSEQLYNKGIEMFINDKSRNSLDGNRLNISKIFKWFQSDFDRDYGSVKKFIAKYIKLKESEKKRILDSKTEIQYNDYNWKLNKK